MEQCRAHLTQRGNVNMIRYMSKQLYTTHTESINQPYKRARSAVAHSEGMDELFVARKADLGFQDVEAFEVVSSVGFSDKESLNESLEGMSGRDGDSYFTREYHYHPGIYQQTSADLR